MSLERSLKRFIADLGAATKAETGKVMKAVMEKVKAKPMEGRQPDRLEPLAVAYAFLLPSRKKYSIIKL